MNRGLGNDQTARNSRVALVVGREKVRKTPIPMPLF